MTPFWLNDASNPPSVESRIFTQTLSKCSPALAEEGERACRESVRLGQEIDAAKQYCLMKSRAFFNLEWERRVIRPIAIRMGYLPPDVECRHEAGQLKAVMPSGHEPDDVFQGVQRTVRR